MFSITKVGDDINSRKIREFVADTISDVDKLPHIKTKGTQEGIESLNDLVEAGSSCFVIENSSVWMLGNDDIWREI